MKSVGVRDLKIHLSAYLRDVARGDIILVTDRSRVVAELRPPGTAGKNMTPEDLTRQRLIDRGLLKPAAAPGSLTWASYPKFRLPRGTSQELLDAEREDRFD